MEKQGRGGPRAGSSRQQRRMTGVTLVPLQAPLTCMRTPSGTCMCSFKVTTLLVPILGTEPKFRGCSGSSSEAPRTGFRPGRVTLLTREGHASCPHVALPQNSDVPAGPSPAHGDRASMQLPPPPGSPAPPKDRAGPRVLGPRRGFLGRPLPPGGGRSGKHAAGPAMKIPEQKAWPQETGRLCSASRWTGHACLRCQ